jgi:hypothetical protein
MRTAFTFDPGPRKLATADGPGYPVNMIYDGNSRVLPMEPNADDPTVIRPTPPERPSR